MHLFLAVLVVGGVAHLEAFPFSAFRLFSELRPSVRRSWELRAVDAEGTETPIRLADLPLGFRNSTTLLLEFPQLSPAARDEVCDAWAEPRRDAGHRVDAVRVYEVVDDVRPGGAAPRRRLAYECGAAP